MGQIYEIRLANGTTRPGQPKTLRNISIGDRQMWNCREELESNDILLFESDERTTWPYLSNPGSSSSFGPMDGLTPVKVLPAIIAGIQFPKNVKAIYRLPNLQMLTSMSSMFRESDVEYLPTLNCSEQMTNMAYMFYKAVNLKEADLSMMITRNVVTMQWLFRECKSLRRVNLDGVDTSKVTDMSCMFNQTDIEEVDLSGFETCSVMTMGSMFYGCKRLKSVSMTSELNDTQNVTDFSGMFNQCSALERADLKSLKSCTGTSTYAMFNACSALRFALFDDFDMSNVANCDLMFTYCESLEIIQGLTNIDKPLDLGYCVKLTTSSIARIIEALVPVDTSMTLKLSGRVREKVDDEQIAEATSKGWTIAFT
ncbi:MAG: BspA family leucine-rich repeat surface protein [Bacteroidales bacterium]|nr:BspA family leucine-rich repeat surface protein [Bacteroidales bacterium]